MMQRFHHSVAAIMSIRLGRFLLPALVVVLADPASAATREGSFGTGEPSGPVLTREELRVCLDRQTRLGAQRAELVKEQGALVDAKAEVMRNGDSLKARLEALDRSDAAAVTAYNNDVQARDKLVDAYEVRVKAFNTRAEANRAEREAFAKGCDNRRYLEEDEVAIKKGK
jgi:hypothetical protein